MNALRIWVLLSTAILAISAEYTRQARDEWDMFKLVNNKQYSTPLEESYRMSIFLETWSKIIQHNLNPANSFTLKLNKFSDLRPDEIDAMMMGYKMDGDQTPEDDFTMTYTSNKSEPAPQTLDWRSHGYVTKVKDQGQCGSCWAFSATGALEGQHKKISGNLVALSEQNLLDCVKKGHGCGGSWMDYAFDYVQENNGINTESSYPYEGRKRQCRHRTNDIRATCKGYGRVKRGDEAALLDAVWNIGPISVAIYAGDKFFSYGGGVYYSEECNEKAINHAVLIVGYGSEDGMDYWLVKNSWGEGWGDRGYIKMSRNRNNNCEIATYAMYPVM